MKTVVERNGPIWKSRVSVMVAVKSYSNNGRLSYKYCCPVCEDAQLSHQVCLNEANCPICGVNLNWDNIAR